MMDGYGVEDVVYSVINGLGKSVDGIKKLMKILFLVQYDIDDLPSRSVVKYLYGDGPITRAEFYLWSFGPISNEVYDIIDELENTGIIKLTAINNLFTMVRVNISEGMEVNLPRPVSERIDEVIKKYGGLKGWELERRVKERLDLTIEEKRSSYMGYSVDDYLREEGFRLTIRDLAHEKVTE